MTFGSSRRGRHAWWAVVLLTLMSVACAPADRAAQADELVRQVAAMPGVVSVNPGYINDFENGANLNVVVEMPTALRPQIEAVAARINELTGTAFGGYRQSTTFEVGGGAEVVGGAHLDPTAIGSATQVVRQIAPDAPDAQTQWTLDGPAAGVMIRYPADGDRAVRAALAALGDIPPHLEVRSGDPARSGSWDITGALGSDALASIISHRATWPVTTYQVAVTDGRISGVTVGVETPPDTGDWLAKIAASAAASPQHPLTVEWRLPGDRQALQRVQVCGSSLAIACPG